MNLRPKHNGGSVLVIVLWIAVGLVSIALYFGQSMTFELRAADNRMAGREAEQAIDGAARYISYILTQQQTNGLMPDPLLYASEAAVVGEAQFWLVGRDPSQRTPTQPTFGLVDEASKININTAGTNLLTLVPGMTAELMAAIIDWRDTDSDLTQSGAEDETYARLNPAYKCKNAPFESIEELRLVYGMTAEILYGEDANMNGILDANESDGTASLPNDNGDSRLDPGLLEYLTVYSREPNTDPYGSNRVNVASLQQPASQQQLRTLLENAGIPNPERILPLVQNPPVTSVLEFYNRVRDVMTFADFTKIEASITTATNQITEGLINICTASEAVLACIPGIGLDYASSVAAYRQSNPDKLGSVAWLAEALQYEQSLIQQAGPFITARSYQFTADVAATGHRGRGYRRVRFVFDTSSGTPRIAHRQDVTRLGWALGTDVRQNLLLANTVQ